MDASPLPPSEPMLPDGPRSRLPWPVWSLLALLAVAATVVVAVTLVTVVGFDWRWGVWTTTWTVWAGTVLTATALFTVVAWARAPRGGWRAEFRVPLPVRVLLRVLVSVGVWGLTFMAAGWLLGEGVPEPAVGIGVTVVLTAALIVSLRVVAPWWEPVGGVEAMFDDYRPRGALTQDPLTAAEVAEVTGRAVVEVIRLDTPRPGVPAMPVKFGGFFARFVLDDGAMVETWLMFLSGATEGFTAGDQAASRNRGTTPAERLAVLRRGHRLEPVAETGADAYACVPTGGGPEWLWVRLADAVALELRTSAGVDRAVRLRLARTAATRFAPERLWEDPSPS